MERNNKEPEFVPRKSPLEQLGENVEVLSTQLKAAQKTQKDDAEQIQKANTAIELFRYDLGNPERRHGYTPTRIVAMNALRQSEGFISVENLEGHKVIKDLTEELDKYVGQVNKKFAHLQRGIEAIPEPDNMHDLLKSDYTFQDLNKKVEGIESDQGLIEKGQKELRTNFVGLVETYNGNDHPTGPQFDEIILDIEMFRTMHNDLVHFLKGVFAKMGFDPVAKCVAEYKIRTQTESKDNEKPTEDPK